MIIQLISSGVDFIIHATATSFLYTVDLLFSIFDNSQDDLFKIERN